MAADEAGLIEIYAKYMDSCMSAHLLNADKEDYLYNFFLGSQDIKDKTRGFIGEIEQSDRNNRVVENHANAQVKFKVDFLLGDKMQFTHKTDTDSDDLTIFERFLSDSGFYTEQRNIKQDMYAMGVGVSYTAPDTDIINDDGTYSQDYDKDTQSPFLFSSVDPRKNFVVYSSYFGTKPLFCVSIVDNGDNTCDLIVNNGVYTFIYKNAGFPTNFSLPEIPDEIKVNGKLKDLPIIEHCYNKDRMGIVELNRDLFNMINLVVSNSGDAIVDTVNDILVFENVEVDKETIQEMRKGGAIKVKSSGDPNAQSKVYTLEVSLNHADINVFYEQRVSKAYDIAGVPIASGVTTSGGDTGKARLLGGGWENAYNKIKGDIVGMEKTDTELLKSLLNICHTVPDTRVDELSASQIEIKYNINPNDNILAKSQSASNLYNIGMPTDMILTQTNLSMDVHSDGAKWQENIDKKQEMAMKKKDINGEDKDPKDE